MSSHNHGKGKYYILVEFPYPSGDGLHIGHTRPYTAMDILARKRRMEGYEVLFPFGFDAFGLPTENYAIKNKIHPKVVTERNIEHFRKQCDAINYSFDREREVTTTDPDFYKWTQWIFLEMFKRGLAYKAKMPVNWCTSCKCVLANEEVVDGVCERCGAPVVRKEKSQWMLKITDYAEKLLGGLESVDYIERAKTQQKNWIGKSTGAEVCFQLTVNNEQLTVYTTRPDTLFGATYMVIAPEHAILEKLRPNITNWDEVQAYITAASRKSDFERAELNKDKTGVEIKGVRAVNPATNGEIPIFAADYVLASYGTGAIMAVPGHDTRDWEFAKAYNLPIIEVVSGGDVASEAYTGDGVAVNSAFLDGLRVSKAKAKMIEWLAEKGLGTAKTNYKLRDWVFSRQRYWGEPIPVVYCEKCGYVALPESELPLLLPEVESYETTDDGESPLSQMTDWVQTTCPCCGGSATRETDTMPQWAGSSWYYLRYMDPRNKAAIASPEALKHWGMVDWYNGGMEHTTLHLLYSRFWHRFLYDIGVVPNPEPYAKRTSHGMILGWDGQKMAKSSKAVNPKTGKIGNMVTPEEVIGKYGADTLRLYIMFVGDFEQPAKWSDDAIKGCRRFLDRVAALCEKPLLNKSRCENALHKTIQKVTDDIELLKFNTAIASMMSLLNELYDKGAALADLKPLLTLLYPFAPSSSQANWKTLGLSGEVSGESWPEYDPALLADDEKTIAIQVNGKLRGTIVLPTDSPDEIVISAAKADEKAAKFLEGLTFRKAIVVKNKLVNLIYN
ncbi:MAG: leucine--tRNA ligase [Oscillospiraceae bacterium]|jgi:leucyl-tRNA synthetase|nr:leucine--tRNA ligase [Oscillospiraceae bacterium]